MNKTERKIKAERRRLDAKVRALQAERRAWLSGTALKNWSWYGLPWCNGRCGEPTCEGCGTRAVVNEQDASISAQIAEIDAQIEALITPVEPALEGELFAMRAGQWVYA